MVRRVVVASLLTLANSSRAAAQGDIRLTMLGIGWIGLGVASIARLTETGRPAFVGDSVRLITASPARPAGASGRLVAVSPDSFTIRTADGAASFGRSDIRKLEVYAGREAKWAQGWVSGLVIGGVGLGALGLASGNDRPCNDDCFTAAEKGVIGLTFGGFMGSLIGAGVGAGLFGERWMHASSAPPSRVSVTPVVGRRIGVGVGVSF
jgi:hypothetical protein